MPRITLQNFEAFLTTERLMASNFVAIAVPYISIQHYALHLIGGQHLWRAAVGTLDGEADFTPD